MKTLVVVTGTGTEVGKTFVAAATIAQLRKQSITVAARKPAQSFDPDDQHPHDSAVLSAASGETDTEVCPANRRYPIAMAPPMAADALRLPPILLQDLMNEIAATSADVMMLEGAGGLRSPLAHDGDGLDLMTQLPTALAVVVADAGLGTINAVTLTVDAIRLHCRVPIAVILNRYNPADSLHVANRVYLQHHSPARILTTIAELAIEIINVHRESLRNDQR